MDWFSENNQARASAEAQKPKRPARVLDPRRRIGWKLALMAAAFTAAAIGQSSAAGAQGIDREYKFKAVYLYKFATYTRWPNRAFTNDNSPFVFGILGPDPVGADLQRIAAVKTIGQRKIVVRRYQNVNQIRNCHILFMSRANNAQFVQAACQKLAGRNILLVGDTVNSIKQGTVFAFSIQQNRIRIHISIGAVQRAGLTVNAQLLRIAEKHP